MEAINISKKFTEFSDYWSPKVVGELNGQHVRLAKLHGEFVWHHHDHEDELFLVVKGRLLMKLRDREIWINEGEFIIIPRGVEHLPVAKEEVQVILFEPATTLNTGNIENQRTVKVPKRV